MAMYRALRIWRCDLNCAVTRLTILTTVQKENLTEVAQPWQYSDCSSHCITAIAIDKAMVVATLPVCECVMLQNMKKGMRISRKSCIPLKKRASTPKR